MSGPSSVREALIAEALGEMASVLNRIEAVKPDLAEACNAVTRASAMLAAQAAAMESRVGSITNAAAAQAVQRVARRADEQVRAAADVETQAMAAAARQIFREELAPALQRFARAMDGKIGGNRWHASTWWSHALTACVAIAATWILASCVLAR